MQPQTAFRLAMLRNGYAPTLNDCKRPVEPGWPRKPVDEAEVLSWDRSALLSTGMRIDGDLAVIDVDATEENLVEKLADTLDKEFPELFARGLIRHAGGTKEAWIVRVEEPFARLASRRWYWGGDPDDPAVAKHHVECFGSRSPRQFGVDGPHAASRRWYRNGNPDDPAIAKHHVECFGSRASRQFGVDGPHARDRRGAVISTYQFAADASPATVARAELPVLPLAAFAAACDRFDEIAKAAGLTAVDEARRGPDGASDRCFELDAEMAVETADSGP